MDLPDISIQLHVDMLQPRGVSGPCRYILEVRGAVASAKSVSDSDSGYLW